MAIETVTSLDGTIVAYHRQGKGHPLVLVPGTGGANPVLGWTAVTPSLEERFTLYSIDRRGRGSSDDRPPYAIEREFEDIAAVIDAIGKPANVLGHSFGALCVLGAVLLTKNIRKVILYEPVISLPGVPTNQVGLTERIESRLAAGDREGAYIAFLSEEVGMSPPEIEQMKNSPAWPSRLAAAHTLSREFRAEEEYQFDSKKFKDFQTPTLLIQGGDSPIHFKESTAMINASLPNSILVVMPGQQHIAMYTAPNLFLKEIIRFLSDPVIDHQNDSGTPEG